MSWIGISSGKPYLDIGNGEGAVVLARGEVDADWGWVGERSGEGWVDLGKMGNLFFLPRPPDGELVSISAIEDEMYPPSYDLLGARRWWDDGCCDADGSTLGR